MKKKIKKMLQSKRIVLFGITEETNDFCESFKEKCNIICCVTNYAEDLKLQPLAKHGIDTVLYDDMEFCAEDFIVICDLDKYQPIERRLRLDGFKEFDDYVSSQVARAVLEDKRIAVFMGMQSMNQLKQVLCLADRFRNEYFCAYFDEDNLLSVYANQMAEYRHISKLCDLYVASNSDKDMYDSKLIRRELLLPDCKYILISDYTFAGYFPQIEANRNKYSNFFFRERKRLNMPYATIVMAREDCNLRDMVNANIPINEIVARICNPQFYDKNEVLDCYKSGLQCLEKADQFSDIKVAEFVKESGVICYCNLDEWSADMLHYVAQNILQKIGLSYALSKDDITKHETDISFGTEILIYPSVIEHLCLPDRNQKEYKVVNYYNTFYLDMKEYISYCAEMMYQIKDFSIFLELGAESYAN